VPLFEQGFLVQSLVLEFTHTLNLSLEENQTWTLDMAYPSTPHSQIFTFLTASFQFGTQGIPKLKFVLADFI
jgi:hypothetical protein